MLRLLDVFFFVFHTGLILFILFGWIWRPSRKVHLAVVAGTAFSWIGLGFWYGFGYCPCTDWHWRVRMALGDTDLPNSYIKFLVDAPTGWDVNARLVDLVTCAAFVVATAISIYLNMGAFRPAGKKHPPEDS